MKILFLKGKSKHTRILGIVTAMAILLILFSNILFSQLGLYNLAYLDLTPEGYYTLTDKMEQYCEGILEPEGKEKIENIKITFCRDPDALVKDFEMCVTYFMALALANRFDGVTVETVNIKYNPTAVSAYKTTSRQNIKSSDIIISYGSKYRIATSDSFWTANSDGSNFSYNGEYKMASILASLTAINSPCAYFVTDHGESYYDPENPDSETSIKNAAFADLLIERGMQIKTLKLSEDEIPEDCALLIINNPTLDLATDPDGYSSISYVSEAEKIDRYLINNLGSLIVNKAYDVKLPVLESLLAEWGIAFGDGVVRDEDRVYESPMDNDYNILGVYDTSEDGIGGAYYGSYAGLSSAPDMLFKNSGYVYCAYSGGEVMPEPGTLTTDKTYAPFIGTTDKAYATLSLENAGSITADEGYKALAALSARVSLDNTTNESTYAYIFASNSEYFYSNEVLGNASFANYDIMATVISNISRTERHASIELGGTSVNSPSFGGKQTVDMTLKDYKDNVYSWDGKEVVKVNYPFTTTARGWFTAAVCVAPVCIFAVGLVVFIRRRYL